MAGRIHFNPETGETGKCGAATENGCPFREESGHYPTAGEAREGYENYMRAELEKTLIKGRRRFSNYINHHGFDDVVMVNIQGKEYIDEETDLEWGSDHNWGKDHERAIGEVWSSTIDYESGAIAEVVFEENQVTAKVYTGSEGVVGTFTIDRADHDEAGEDMEVFRANVLKQASEMAADKTPEHFPEGKYLKYIEKEYENDLINFEGMDLVKTNNDRPETWEVKGDKDAGVESIKMRYHYGEAEIVVFTKENDWQAIPKEHVLLSQQYEYDESLNFPPAKSSFSQPIVAARFIAVAQKAYSDFIDGNWK